MDRLIFGSRLIEEGINYDSDGFLIMANEEYVGYWIDKENGEIFIRRFLNDRGNLISGDLRGMKTEIK